MSFVHGSIAMCSEIKTDDIPNSVLLRIFSHYVRSEGNKNLLDNIANVCTKWRTTALLPALWNDIQVHEETKTTLEDLRQFAARGLLSDVRNLMIIDNRRQLERDVFKNVVSKCHSLEKLYVHGLDLGIDLSDVAVSCPSLEELRVSNRVKASNRYCKFNIRKFKACCPRMKELALRNVVFECDGASEDDGFQMLRSFSCYGGMKDRELYLLVGKSPNLVSLLTSNDSMDVLLKLSTDKLQKLEFLSRRGGTTTDGEVGANVMRKWKHSLKILKVVMMIGWNSRIDFEFGNALRQLVDVAETSENPISFVKLHGVSVKLDDLAHFVRYARNLVHLDLSETYGLSTVYRRKYSSRGSVEGLAECLMKHL